MKDPLRTLFAPILKPFETGEGAYEYKPFHRTALLIIAGLFAGLAGLVLSMVWEMDPAYLLPVFVFGGLAFVSLIVGVLGSNRAVATIWKSKR